MKESKKALITTVIDLVLFSFKYFNKGMVFFSDIPILRIMLRKHKCLNVIVERIDVRQCQTHMVCVCLVFLSKEMKI